MELSYKELQEQGVFDVPYKAFEFMKKQQAEIDRLQKGFEDLKVWILENEYTEMLYQGNTSEYVVISEYLLDELEEIKGKTNET